MKKKLTVDLIKADLTRHFKEQIVGFAAVMGVLLAMGLLTLPFLIIIESERALFFGVVLAAFFLTAGGFIIRDLLRIKWSQNGEFSVERDIMYRKDMVRKRYVRRRKKFPALFFSVYGTYFVNDIDIDAYNNSECGESFYVVVMKNQPSRVVMAYSPSSYEAEADGE